MTVNMEMKSSGVGVFLRGNRVKATPGKTVMNHTGNYEDRLTTLGCSEPLSYLKGSWASIDLKCPTFFDEKP